MIMNEHKMYWTFDYFTRLKIFLSKYKIPFLLFISEWGWIVPLNTDLFTVVGKGVKIEC